MNSTEITAYYRTGLLDWYDRCKRDLPWRRSGDPYRIWVSEIMLQQTRVETVLPYYNRFIDKFPTLGALAEAPEEEVLKAWEGLGYYSRARNLQAAVREVQEHYGGIVPDEPAEVASLKGVGPYTAGAILSIAYNKPEPAVDGNVMRVLSRFFLLEDDIAKPKARVAIEKLARELIPAGRAGDFNQALMELGATVCTPKSPYCLTCPVMEHCRARLAGREQELPLKTKAKPPRLERRVVALVAGAGEYAGCLLIRQRPTEGLLARLWELPHVELSPDTGSPAPGAARSEAEAGAKHDLGSQLAAADGVTVAPGDWLMDAEHVFSHIRWELRVYLCRLAEEEGGRRLPALPSAYRWISQADMQRYTFPNVFLRILNAYWGDHLPVDQRKEGSGER